MFDFVLYILLTILALISIAYVAVYWVTSSIFIGCQKKEKDDV
jgi:hypothetical protein